MFIPGMEPAGEHANCRLYTNGNFSTTKLEGVHYAFVTDPPTKDAELTDAKRCSTECPSADGQLYVSPTGKNFLMSCKARHGTTVLKTDRRPSFEACMASCAAMPACQSAEYEPRTKRCFYSNNTKRPAITAEAFVSAHSLGCSGACAGCKKGCDQVGRPAGRRGRLRRGSWQAGRGGGPGLSAVLLALLPQQRALADRRAQESRRVRQGLCRRPRCHAVNWMPGTGCSVHPERDTGGQQADIWAGGHLPRAGAAGSVDSGPGEPAATPLRRLFSGVLGCDEPFTFKLHQNGLERPILTWLTATYG